jgi:hypothetical protein
MTSFGEAMPPSWLVLKGLVVEARLHILGQVGIVGTFHRPPRRNSSMNSVCGTRQPHCGQLLRGLGLLGAGPFLKA